MTGVREVATDDRDAGAPEAGLLVEGLTVVTEGRQTPVVQDVGFAVAPGHVMGLVGESGSGKSTIGVALLGLARRGLRIAGGRVCIDGVDILGLQGRNLQNARGRLIAYVPQDPVSGLNPALTVGRQLREAIIIHRDTLPAGETIEQRVHQLMDEVGLPSTDAFLNSYPHQMSGGQQQRVGIAMAFSCRPRVIVLDEPTTGLDVTTQRRVLETVRELTAEHQVTSVYVSHDLAVVAQLADQTAVLYAGRVVEHAATESMFGGARHPYTVGLLKAVPSSARSEILVGIEGRPPRPGRWPQGCSFADRCESVQQTCREELPPLRNIGDSGQSHLARCYFPQPPVSADHAKNPVPTLSGGPLPIVTVRKLAARYGAREVLRDVSFEVLAGRCTAVVGQSGSGKTTLARSLVGLHTAWTGEVEFAGTRLDTQPQRRTKAQRQTLQYVFQNPYSSLNPRMSVRENLEEPLRYFSSLSHRQRTEKVFGVLATVALSEEYAERMPQQLSGGERQRVAVGRALIVDPDVIVCDEITSALDVSVQALLVEQLRRLQNERGLSLVFITHNLAVVRSIAQEVVVLSDGVIVESGSVDRVLDHPTHAYTQSLLADLPSTERS
ncbi:peptide/nickel transport system ATP-binding protein [Mycobacterium sp. OAS707]|uniref:dipeptide ABC transporter ATP-binding protein n=1 Tax=Mycobacterium sp. OAS707 TaxID=2663822 RepID=UPI00178AF554|nr:ABC transporter ATP-binding protein [Mycobacterium sp. OAS707]MBE1551814.1 peptide/nickel transport system ATP-binding protein [Mycobacterium sp. OAS707]